jgi:hypothetical protein
LLFGILRQVASGAPADQVAELADQLAQIVGRKIDVLLDAARLFLFIDQHFEGIVLGRAFRL